MQSLLTEKTDALLRDSENAEKIFALCLAPQALIKR